MVRGRVNVNGVELQTGDAAAVTDEQQLAITGTDSGSNELLLFDLA